MSVFRPSAHALITGGASGVGYAVAQLCLKHSMRVSIVDFNQSSLDIARKNLSGDVNCIQADVSSRSDWSSIRQQVGTDVDFLMLNAGIGGKGTWGDEDYFDKILATNLGGVVNGLNAYVPSLKERVGEGKSAIVITGSKQGITNPPGNPAYNASKAAVKTLAEHLGYDMKDTGVGVHLLVPGWTFTGLVSTLSLDDSQPLTHITVRKRARLDEGQTGRCVVGGTSSRLHVHQDASQEILHNLSRRSGHGRDGQEAHVVECGGYRE